MPLPSRKSPEPQPKDGVFRVLTVCSGNLCRSPQAEQLLRSRIPRSLGQASIEALVVSSAGTMAYDGDPMDPQAAAEAVRLSIPDVAGHRARRIREEHVSEADLVLGMAREHRAASAGLVPSANVRVFTLVEFARIVESLAARTLDIDVKPLTTSGFATFMRGVVEAAGRARGLMPRPTSVDELDIEDPYRLDPEVYRRSADAVTDNVDRIATAPRTLAAGPR